MHVILPWFLPMALLSAFLGLDSIRGPREIDLESHSEARWLMVLMFVPLLIWLLVQFSPSNQVVP